MSGRAIRSAIPGRGIDLRRPWGPVVLHDDPIADDLARVVADVGLMKRMIDVHPGGGEVSEVHHDHEVEVALEMAGVVAHDIPVSPRLRRHQPNGWRSPDGTRRGPSIERQISVRANAPRRTPTDRVIAKRSALGICTSARSFPFPGARLRRRRRCRPTNSLSTSVRSVSPSRSVVTGASARYWTAAGRRVPRGIGTYRAVTSSHLWSSLRR
jgi:hypothetical protein